MVNPKILEAIKELRQNSKKRNFTQSVELIVNLKEIDIKKPEDRFSEDIILPNGRGKDAKVVIFSDEIKDLGLDVEIIDSAKLQRMSKREAKKLARDVDFFLAEPKLMPTIGKVLGQYIGPRGKLPKIISGDIKAMVENYKKSIKIKVKDAPVVQCLVGNESMSDEKIAENIESVLNFLENKLPKGKRNIKKILIKLTMGQPFEVKV
ncbi:MAG: 50S ribosomal protein L1 [Candidatus Aenigmatarchaeota archaeon]